MLAVFLWLICVVVAVVSIVTAQWFAAIFWLAVVVGLFIWHVGWQRIKCWLGHDWDQYHGYYEERPKLGAHCRRENCEAVYHG